MPNKSYMWFKSNFFFKNKCPSNSFFLKVNFQFINKYSEEHLVIGKCSSVSKGNYVLLAREMRLYKLRIIIITNKG